MTRKEYMQKASGAGSHREYYAQFVDAGIRQRVTSAFGVGRLKQALRDDENLNTIALHRWDDLGLPLTVGDQMRELGDSMSMAGQVCVLKEAARQVCEECGQGR